MVQETRGRRACAGITRAVGRPFRDFQDQLGADRLLELRAIAHRDDESARPADHAILEIDVEVGRYPCVQVFGRFSMIGSPLMVMPVGEHLVALRDRPAGRELLGPSPDTSITRRSPRKPDAVEQRLGEHQRAADRRARGRADKARGAISVANASALSGPSIIRQGTMIF